MQDFNQMFAFAMRMPRQRLAQELIKPTGAIPPAIAMAALQKMNSVHAAQPAGPTVAQQLAQGAAAPEEQQAPQQGFAEGGIVKLAGGGDAGGPAPRGMNNPDWIRQKIMSLFGGPEPTAPGPSYSDPGDFKQFSMVPTDYYGPAGADKKTAEQQVNRTLSEDDPSYKVLNAFGMAPTLGTSLALRHPGSWRDDKDLTPVSVPEAPAPQAAPAAAATTAADKPDLSDWSEYYKGIVGALPNRYGDFDRNAAVTEGELKRQRANNLPLALMTAGASMIGRRTPYATEAMGEGARAGLGAFMTGEDAARKAQAEFTKMHGDVGNARTVSDVGLARVAMDDRRTDEYANARREHGQLARQEQQDRSYMNAYGQMMAELRKNIELAVARNPPPNWITMDDVQRRQHIENEIEKAMPLQLRRYPHLARWVESKMGEGAGGGGVTLRAGPSGASGGTPTAPGK